MKSFHFIFLITLISTVPLVLGSCTPALDVIALGERALRLDKRQSRNTWQEAANITLPTEECTDYYYAPIGGLADSYPAVWITADLSQGTADDIALFASMNSSIPNIPPKGTRAGDFTGLVYDYTTDPACWWSATHCVKPKIETIPTDMTTCNEPVSWGFALDDGPNCSHNAFYQYLSDQNQKATMFYIGSNVMDWPLESQAGLAEGHEICAHTWSHPYMTSMTNEEAFAELYYAKKIIKQILGVTVRCWRPPYGDVDDRIRWIAQALDMTTMLWEQDTSDWEYSTMGVAAVETIYEGIIAHASDGTFSTFGPLVDVHELDNGTMQLCEQFLPAIQSAFTGGVMPIGVCNNNTMPYLETSGYTYPNAEQWLAGTTTVSLLQPTAYSTMVSISFASAFMSSVNGTGIATSIASASATSTSSLAKTTTPSQTARPTLVLTSSTAAMISATNTSAVSTSSTGDGSRSFGKVGGLVAAVALFLSVGFMIVE